MQCTATAHSTQQRCGRRAIAGGNVCQVHGGSAPQVKAHAAVRAAVAQWAPGTEMRDPGEVLLQLVTQSIMRAERYAEELDALIAESPDLREALIGDAYGEHGTKVGEYIRGLAVLEAQERDRAASFAQKAIAAGLAERQVRLAEKQGQLMAAVLLRIIEHTTLALSPEQKLAMPQVMREVLAAAATGK